jgi:hypothetical protein
MPLSFPNSPTLNQRVTTGGRVYEWNGSAWVLVGTGVPGVTAIYQDADPSTTTTLAAGTIWVESDVVASALNTNDYVLKSDVESFPPHNFLMMGG